MDDTKCDTCGTELEVEWVDDDTLGSTAVSKVPGGQFCANRECPDYMQSVL